jgi:urease accessory protein
MHARAEIVATLGADGRTRLTRLAGDGPLTLRPTGTAENARVHLVAGVFGPLGGDILTLDVRVGPGAELDVAGVAATLVLPSRDAQPSEMRINIRVGDQARLVLALPPTVVAMGANHTIDTRATLGEGSVLVLREEAVKGRSNEAGGEVHLSTRIDAAGAPVLRQNLDLVGVVGGPWKPRVVGSLLVIGRDAKPPEDLPPTDDERVRAAWLTLARGAGHQLTALGDDPLAVAQLLDGQLPRYTV